MGFTHNNCSGGCVRAGKKQWKRLFEKLPDVYLDREKVEENIRKYLNKNVHFFKDETLRQFRKRIETGQLSSYYGNKLRTQKIPSECVGICNSLN